MLQKQTDKVSFWVLKLQNADLKNEDKAYSLFTIELILYWKIYRNVNVRLA